MILLSLPTADRVELRPTTAKPVATFPEAPRPAEEPGQRLFVNGRATALVVPAGFFLDVRCRNADGRVGGAIFQSYLSDGSMSFAVEGRGFVTEGAGRFHFIPLFADALDDQGRVLGIVGSDFTGHDDPYQANLWDGRRLTDLGPAAKVRFGRGGTIEGYAETDRRGRAINLMEARVYLDEGQERYLPFTWRDGFRDDGPLLRKPPF